MRGRLNLRRPRRLSSIIYLKPMISMKRSFFRLSLFVAIFITMLLGAGFQPWGGTTLAQGGDEPEPVGKAYRGEVIFQQRCAQCHGAQGDGNAPLADQLPDTLPDFTDPNYTRGKTPQELFDVITNGRMDRMMPPWGQELSEAERWDAVAYIWSLSQSPDTIQQARELFDQSCASCHGSNGAGLEEGVPDLRNPHWLEADDQAIIAAFTDEAHPEVAGVEAADLPLLASAVRRFSLGFDQREVVVEGSGDIRVLVKNGTTGEILADHPVRLFIFEQERFVDMREGRTDDAGRARFVGLPTNPTWAYVAEAQYQDLTYHSEPGQFAPQTEMIDLTVSVYDPGATKDAVSIERAHWLIDLSTPGFVDVGEVYVFANSADRVYAGEKVDPNAPPRVLEIPLPEGAVNIVVEGQGMDDRFQIDGTTVVDTQPLPPGTMQLFLRYTLPVMEDQVVISHPLPYYTRMLNLLVPDIGIQVNAPDWQEDEPIATENGDFLNYIILDLPAGSEPKAMIRGITDETVVGAEEEPREIIARGVAPGISSDPRFSWALVGLGVVILGVALAVGWRRYSQVRAALPTLREEQKQSLVAQIAALDEAFEAGEIPRDRYDEQRNLLKLQLIALLRQDREEGSPAESLTQLAQTPKIHPEEEPIPSTEVTEETRDDDNTLD
ncbi:MAG TPA: c-type cytochrome [Anaerolineae bacterium]|nr:c-type cytochrome [Anaerolineae bacterium]